MLENIRGSFRLDLRGQPHREVGAADSKHLGVQKVELYCQAPLEELCNFGARLGWPKQAAASLEDILTRCVRLQKTADKLVSHWRGRAANHTAFGRSRRRQRSAMDSGVLRGRKSWVPHRGAGFKGPRRATSAQSGLMGSDGRPRLAMQVL